jgi:hypothetical protein
MFAVLSLGIWIIVNQRFGHMPFRLKEKFKHISFIQILNKELFFVKNKAHTHKKICLLQTADIWLNTL